VLTTRIRARAAARRWGVALAGVTALAGAALISGCTRPQQPGGEVTGLPPAAPPPGSASPNDPFLDTLQQRTFRWFWETTNPRNGLTPDRHPTKSFSSVAAVGFALSSYPVGVERGYVTREQAAERTLTTLRFLYNSPQGEARSGVAGHKGFFYHFLDMETGLRFEQVELSTIDTSLLLAGAITCQEYFDGASPTEAGIRAYADSLYRRVDWRWVQTKPPLISMGWHPEKGFIDSYWVGYDEAMILLVLAMGSPTYPMGPEIWTTFTNNFKWAPFYGYEHVNFAPLFGHQYSHTWLDFRGIRDAHMRGKGIDYFENARRATLSQRAYAVENPMGWRDYGADVWGLTASDGPGDTTITIDGKAREFHSYWARGVDAHERRDDGTIAPTAAGGSIAYAPEVVLPALKAMRAKYGDDLFSTYGFVDAFNATLRDSAFKLKHGRIVPGKAWFDIDYLGIDQGPIVLMAENYRTGLIWNLMKKNPHIVRGLCRAGFTGGWIEGKCS